MFETLTVAHGLSFMMLAIGLVVVGRCRRFRDVGGPAWSLVGMRYAGGWRGFVGFRDGLEVPGPVVVAAVLEVGYETGGSHHFCKR